MNPVEEDRALDGESDLSFENGPRGREAMDPTTRHLVFIACGIGLLLLVLIGGWTFSGRSSGSIPVIEALPGPVRLKPIDPGGMQPMGAQAPSPVSASGVETLAPRPETARPEALQAEVDAARGREDAVPAGVPPARLQAQPVQEPTTTVPGDPPAGLPGAATPDAATPDAATGGTTLPADSRLRTETNPQETGSDAAAGTAVQLAALDSHDAADTEWGRLRHSHPRLFSGRKPDVEAADRDGRRIYRLRTGGFSSVAEAHAFCAQARAQRVACTLADF